MKTLAPSYAELLKDFPTSKDVIHRPNPKAKVTTNMSIIDGLDFSESLKAVADLENFLKVKSK